MIDSVVLIPADSRSDSQSSSAKLASESDAYPVLG